MRFELDLHPLMTIGIELLRVELLVGPWAAGTAPAGGEVLSTSLVDTAGENASYSCCKTT